MTTLAYAIAPTILEAHPGYRRGVLVVRDARNDADGAALEAALRVEEDRLRQRVAGADVATLPAIAAWRDAYRRFGAKPSEHRSSIEAMTRRVARPGRADGLPAINPLVDIGNLVSLRHGLPAGTQTSRETRDVLFNVDGLPPIVGTDVEAAMADIERLVRQHTGGRIVLSTTLSAQQPSFRAGVD